MVCQHFASIFLFFASNAIFKVQIKLQSLRRRPRYIVNTYRRVSLVEYVWNTWMAVIHRNTWRVLSHVVRETAAGKSGYFAFCLSNTFFHSNRKHNMGPHIHGPLSLCNFFSSFHFQIFFNPLNFNPFLPSHSIFRFSYLISFLFFFYFFFSNHRFWNAYPSSSLSITIRNVEFWWKSF